MVTDLRRDCEHGSDAEANPYMPWLSVVLPKRCQDIVRRAVRTVLTCFQLLAVRKYNTTTLRP